MKKAYSSIASAFPKFSMAAMFGFLLLNVFAISASAQSAEPAAPAAISTVDLEDPNWKIPSEYGSIVSAERAIAAQKMAGQGIPAAELATLTGYDRMLEYMQADLAAWLPIGSIAAINHKRVLTEAPAEPALQAMDVPAFNEFYTSLVAKLVRQ